MLSKSEIFRCKYLLKLVVNYMLSISRNKKFGISAAISSYVENGDMGCIGRRKRRKIISSSLDILKLSWI